MKNKTLNREGVILDMENIQFTLDIGAAGADCVVVTGLTDGELRVSAEQAETLSQQFALAAKSGKRLVKQTRAPRKSKTAV